MSEIHEIAKHLDELRARILRFVIVVGIITVFILTFHLTPIEINGIALYYPTPEPLDNIAAQITNYMKQQLVPEQVQLIQTAPGQAFFAQIYIAALVGIVLGMPVIISEITGFIRPALKEREINVSRAIVIPAFGLSFQLPLIMYAVTASGIIDASFWRKNIRYAIVVIVIFGAVITPDGSGITMWFIAGPMFTLYVAGMFFVERKERKSKKIKF